MTIREVRIAVTVNLGNYENIKLEVMADTWQEAGAALEIELRQMEKVTDESTKLIISRYIDRVLGGFGAESEDPEPEKVAPEPEPAPKNPARVKSLPGNEPVVVPKNSGIVCSRCKKEMTGKEQKLSQLLTNLNLCQKCLDELTVKE